MHKLALTAAAAAAILAGSLLTTGANALTLGTSGVRAAVDAVDPIDKVGCWRWGYNGWGWYPYCGGGYRYHHYHRRYY